ncbi:MAG: His/Gly/Thr/Pro-type tRNA ligase C-terminal domain-containing protein, partial [Bacteroidales bacterium]
DRLKQDYMCQYDEKDAIGRRYRRQDAIGTPYCITVDYDTMKDNTVTIRERDTMKQERIPIEKISEVIGEKLKLL